MRGSPGGSVIGSRARRARSSAFTAAPPMVTTPLTPRRCRLSRTGVDTANTPSRAGLMRASRRLRSPVTAGRERPSANTDAEAGSTTTLTKRAVGPSAGRPSSKLGSASTSGAALIACRMSGRSRERMRRSARRPRTLAEKSAAANSRPRAAAFCSSAEPPGPTMTAQSPRGAAAAARVSARRAAPVRCWRGALTRYAMRIRSSFADPTSGRVALRVRSSRRIGW